MMTQRLSKWTLTALLTLALTQTGHGATSADTLYKHAYSAESIDRDPTKAIDLYKEVLKSTADQDPLAAKAHLRLGICYEKLGKIPEARLSYQDVVDMSEAPQAVVQQAREHLQRLQPPAVVAAAAATQTVPAPPWNDAHRLELTINPGYSIPVGPFGDFYGNSAVLQASLMYQTNRWLALGLDVGYSFKHDLKEHGQFVFDNGLVDNYTFTEKFLQVTPTLRVGAWQPASGFSWMPYLAIGAGVYREMISFTDKLEGSTPNTEVAISPQSSTQFGLNGGLGVALRIQDRFLLGVEARYHRLFVGDRTFKPTSDDIEFFIPVAKIGIMF